MGSHALSATGRGITNKFGGFTPIDMIAASFRCICQGFKVCAEIGIMLADAGLVPVGEEIITIGGTAKGVDTAVVMTYCNTDCTNVFLLELSKQFKDDVILLCCDGAAWHKSKTLEIPENIVLYHIPPYTPEMNPIEQIWKEIRKKGFRNEIFATLEKVVDRLCDTICSLTADTIRSITARNWIVSCFN